MWAFINCAVARLSISRCVWHALSARLTCCVKVDHKGGVSLSCSRSIRLLISKDSNGCSMTTESAIEYLGPKAV